MVKVDSARRACLVFANVLLPVAILVFATGFFPYKPLLLGLAEFENGDMDKSLGTWSEAPFDRIVFMVIDALRSDFVYGNNSGFEYTQGLIRSGAAIPFTAHATPPTVTMPRIKALTTGSVPSFLDIILNVAESDTSSSLSVQDTWLAQIRAGGGKLVFYGDDTWLKLFPGDFFTRSDGTSSFFVSDFTEVDNNVTRHIPEELTRDDWNVMILHYLGLDHIGHKTGPNGPNMLPKQKEMDRIVAMIFEAMTNEPHHSKTLLVLAGDHGMNGGGNHGGSGPGETEPALLFASPVFEASKGRRRSYDSPAVPRSGTDFHFYTKVQQNDLVPSLASLMGYPISKNSLGILIPELADLLPPGERLRNFRRNANQILQLVQATYGTLAFENHVAGFKSLGLSSERCQEEQEPDARLACLWVCAQNTPASDGSQIALLQFLKETQDILSRAASSYHVAWMAVGMLLTLAVLVMALISQPKGWPPSTSGVFFGLTSLFAGLLMFGSSFVEEEQNFWYWLLPFWIALITIGNTASFNWAAQSMTSRSLKAAAALLVLAVHRIAIRWNQTGQKHFGDPDIVHTFFPRNHIVMWVLVLVTYGVSGSLLISKTFKGILSLEIAALASAFIVCSAVVFKLNFTSADAPELVQGLAFKLREWTEPLDLVLQARISFLALAAATLIVTIYSIASLRAKMRPELPSLSERLHHILTCFLLMQTRTSNIPLFLGFELQRQSLSYLLGGEYSASRDRDNKMYSIARTAKIATTTLIISHVYFYCMGGSNSISSVDLSNAYNGVASYNIVAVGVLLFSSNWTGPIWWCSAANLLLAQYSGREESNAELENAQSKSRLDGKPAATFNGAPKIVLEPQSKFAEDLERHRSSWTGYLSFMTAFVSCNALAVMAACTLLRTHLFIWTVFSPKFLYAMAWSGGWHLLINAGLGNIFSYLSDK